MVKGFLGGPLQVIGRQQFGSTRQNLRDGFASQHALLLGMPLAAATHSSCMKERPNSGPSTGVSISTAVNGLVGR
ncbi:hypothetical protein K788_0002150 (plasmid) [Paraburkholderia caribensis MBA4]|uniref:Uncharacterized protein n=1 Tax=Paraburkholderia caribensis MBA4 TaxID=1323664 RepID=A0A0P0RPW6_9BURK|nr:hypothetical protein K788_0002150 [Paraburkholderia caribensis MBA4]